MPGLTAERQVSSTRIRSPRPSGRRLSHRTNGALILAYVGIALLSFNVVRVSSVAISDYVFAAATLLAWAYIIAGRTRAFTPPSMRQTPQLMLLGIGLLLTGGVLSSLWSLDPFGSMVEVFRLLWITILWFWLFRAVLATPNALRAAIHLFEWTMSVASVIAIADYLGITSLGNSPVTGRESAYFTHPNMLGGALAGCLPFVIVDLQNARNEKDRIRFLTATGQLALLVIALGTTGSMSAMAATISGLITLGVVRLIVRNPHQTKRRNPLAFMAFTIIGGWLLLTVAGSELPVVERFTGIITGEGSSGVQRSVESRPGQNLYVIDQIDRFLIIGLGHDRLSGSSEWEPGDAIIGDSVHNITAKLLWEAGLIAVIGYLIIVLATFRQVWLLVRHSTNSESRTLAGALLASLVAVNISAQMNPVMTERWYWIPTAFIGAAWVLRRRELTSLEQA